MYVVSCGWFGRPVLMNITEFAVHRFPALHVLTVQPFDELMSWLSAPIVGMVPIAEQELAGRRGMLPDPPAARLVTVVLLDQLVDARGNRAEDAELLQIRAEPGPEPVVRTGLVDGARVLLEPVTELPRVEHPEEDRHRTGARQGGHDDQAPPHGVYLPEGLAAYREFTRGSLEGKGGGNSRD